MNWFGLLFWAAFSYSKHVLCVSWQQIILMGTIICACVYSDEWHLCRRTALNQHPEVILQAFSIYEYGYQKEKKKKEDGKWQDLAHSFLFGSVLLRYFDLIRRQILKNF